ncbi:transporter substrate-binding domain-containing protein [Undibacterium sp. TJN25]|uniref:transporter substrate-binding domain-containing protein n=1 Tax=Undibacterium sp. TJN25 TaxID=3413056 RepID=UPI003BF2EECE
MHKQKCLLLAMAGLLDTAQAAGTADITLLYVEHPAFHFDKHNNGKMEGLIAVPVTQAFQQAGVSYKWQQIPLARQYQILQDSQESACIVGALKNPEREKVGKFSHPIYLARPVVALTRADNAAMTDGRKLEETLRQPQLTMLSKVGYSFGKFVDDSVARYQPRTETTSAELPNMLNMLMARRGDYFFMSEDAYAALVAASSFRPEQFKLVHFSDMTKGNLRYLWCSKIVPNELLDKLNPEIDKLFRKG